MTRDQVEELLELWDETALFADGFDGAIIGLADHRWGSGMIRVVYGIEECLRILQQQGLDEDGANEHFEFNVAGAYVGEGTPIFVATGAIE